LPSHQQQSIIFVLCGATALKEEHRLRVFESRVLSKIQYMGLTGTRYQGTGEDYIMRSFIICTAHQILFRRSNQEE
jgi:hypothetical protein